MATAAVANTVTDNTNVNLDAVIPTNAHWAKSAAWPLEGRACRAVTESKHIVPSANTVRAVAVSMAAGLTVNVLKDQSARTQNALKGALSHKTVILEVTVKTLETVLKDAWMMPTASMDITVRRWIMNWLGSVRRVVVGIIPPTIVLRVKFVRMRPVCMVAMKMMTVPSASCVTVIRWSV